MTFHVITLFPDVVEAYTSTSILGRAQRNKKLKIKTYQLRDFATTPAKRGRRGTSAWSYKQVDDRPYGGGPGMVLQALPVVRAVEKIKVGLTKPNFGGGEIKKIIITSASGKLFTNAYAKKLAKEKNIIIVCGRYEGIDARVKKILRADEVSIGPYILTGGEIPALAIIDATARHLPGVLGKRESLEERRVAGRDVYTRPEVIKHKGETYRVPRVLLSGNHARINALRAKKRSGLH